MSGLAERMRHELAEEPERIRREQEAAAERQAKARADRVEHLRAALDHLDDQLVEVLSYGGQTAADLITEATTPIRAERGERRNILEQAERAKQLRPIVKAEVERLSKEIKDLDKDKSFANNEWERGRLRSPLVEQLEYKTQQLQMYAVEIERAEGLE